MQTTWPTAGASERSCARLAIEAGKGDDAPSSDQREMAEFVARTRLHRSIRRGFVLAVAGYSGNRLPGISGYFPV